jgi:hypothetical protein
MTEIQRLARTECPSYERPPFQTTVRYLVVPSAVKHYLDTKEAKNMVNRAGVKRYILEWAKYTRHHPFSRVAAYVPAEVNGKVRYTLATMPEPQSLEAAVEELERIARSHARSVVIRNPSLGKTLK